MADGDTSIDGREGVVLMLRCPPAAACVCVQIPTFGFLYVAGYIGYVGRQYLIQTKAGAKATEKEIIIDVPLALKLAFQGWTWPVSVVQVRGAARQHTGSGAPGGSMAGHAAQLGGGLLRSQVVRLRWRCDEASPVQRALLLPKSSPTDSARPVMMPPRRSCATTRSRRSPRTSPCRPGKWPHVAALGRRRTDEAWGEWRGLRSPTLQLTGAVAGTDLSATAGGRCPRCAPFFSWRSPSGPKDGRAVGVVKERGEEAALSLSFAMRYGTLPGAHPAGVTHARSCQVSVLLWLTLLLRSGWT